MKKQIVLIGTLLAGTAMADSTLVYNNAQGKESSIMHLSDGVVKMSSTEGNSKTDVIFRNGQTEFTVIMHDEKKYMTFGAKEIEMLSDVSAMMDKMIEKQMANVPEAQRAQMREMMAGMIKSKMPKQAPVPEYRKTGDALDVNGYNCDVVEKITKGKNTDDFCVAEFGELGVSKAEYQAIRGMMKVAEKLASQFGNDTSMNFEQIGQVLPVQYDMNGVKASLVNVSHGSLPAGTFKVPEGYQKQSLPEIGM